MPSRQSASKNGVIKAYSCANTILDFEILFLWPHLSAILREKLPLTCRRIILGLPALPFLPANDEKLGEETLRKISP